MTLFSEKTMSARANDLISAGDACLILGTTTAMAVHFARRGQLKPVRRKGHVFFHARDVLALRDQRAARPRGRGRPTLGETLARRMDALRQTDDDNQNADGGLVPAQAPAPGPTLRGHRAAHAPAPEARVRRSSSTSTRRAR
jgi:hypothetical protein